MVQMEATSYRVGHRLRLYSGRGKLDHGTFSSSVAHNHCPRKTGKATPRCTFTSTPLHRVSKLSPLHIDSCTPLLSNHEGLSQCLFIVQHPQWSRQVLPLINGVTTPSSQESRKVSHQHHESLQLSQRILVCMQSTEQKWPQDLELEQT